MRCWGLAYAICGLGTVTHEGIPKALTPDVNIAKNLWATAFALCNLPEAAHNLGVSFWLGHIRPVELPKAAEWYGAAKDCDLTGAIVGDTPNGRHGDLEALLSLGPLNDDQDNFVNQAVSDYRAVRRAVRREMGVIDPRDDIATYKAKGLHDLANVMEKSRRLSEGEEEAGIGHLQI